MIYQHYEREARTSGPFKQRHYFSFLRAGFQTVTRWRKKIGRWCTDHGCLFYNRVVGLLQVAVENVTKHTGRILMQIPSSLGHPVVFTPDWNVDALFLRKNNEGDTSRECLSKKLFLVFVAVNSKHSSCAFMCLALHVDQLTSRASVMMQPITAQILRVPSMSSLRREDLSWSMGTNQAPIAGVAVLSKFNCL